MDIPCTELYTFAGKGGGAGYRTHDMLLCILKYRLILLWEHDTSIKDKRCLGEGCHNFSVWSAQKAKRATPIFVSSTARGD